MLQYTIQRTVDFPVSSLQSAVYRPLFVRCPSRLCALWTRTRTQHIVSSPLHFTLYTYHVHCKLFTLHCMLYAVHFTLYTVHCKLYLHSVHFKVYTVHLKCHTYYTTALKTLECAHIHCSTNKLYTLSRNSNSMAWQALQTLQTLKAANVMKPG